MKLSGIKLSDVLASIALLISIASAGFTYVQTRTAHTQLNLARLQIRPYVRVMPMFEVGQDDQLSVEEASENFSSVPAYTIYSSLTAWVDGRTTGDSWFHRGGDILYENKLGASFLPNMPRSTAKLLLEGKSHLQIGTCVVYRSISSTDTRRWEAKAFYAYEPGSDVPETYFVKEREVGRSTKSCNSGNIRRQWLSLGEHPIKQPPQP